MDYLLQKQNDFDNSNIVHLGELWYKPHTG